jgi:adhesin transport system membrane fusion protein
MNYADPDLSFERSCRSVLEGGRLKRANWLLVMILFSLIALGVWAHFSVIDETTRGQGKVIPSSAIHTIQSLEGGLLAELAVSEGDRVTKGQMLLRIDDTQFASQFQESTARRDVLEAKIARLTAESVEASDLEFSERIRAERPDLVKRETTLFESRGKVLKDQTAIYQRSLDLANEEMTMTRPLVERGVVSKVEELRLSRQINELTGSVQSTQLEFRRGTLEEQDVALAELERLEETIKGFEDRVNRAVVLSPVDGVINRIEIKNVGGVIGPGEKIMEIVPSDNSLLIQANIRPADIAFLSPGQDALTKITAYDFAVYGGLEGVVEHISADTIQDDMSGERFYQIKIRTTLTTLEHNGEQLPIIPGMVAEIDILTGRRTVLQYLMKPFNRARGRALSER